jgi:hypothetical protein
MLQKQRFTSGNIKRNSTTATMLAGYLSIFNILDRVFHRGEIGPAQKNANLSNCQSNKCLQAIELLVREISY